MGETMTEKQTDLEWVQWPDVADQTQILREYQKFLLNVDFKDLHLNEYQQQALKTYMRAAADGSTGTQISQKLRGWPVCWICKMHKVKKLMYSLQKDLKSKRNPQIRAKAQEKVFAITSVPPFRSYTLLEAVKMRCSGLNTNRLKERGVTETQVRKIRVVLQGLEANEPFYVIAGKVRVPESEIRLIAKTVREKEQIKM